MVTLPAWLRVGPADESTWMVMRVSAGVVALLLVGLVVLVLALDELMTDVVIMLGAIIMGMALALACVTCVLVRSESSST